ncbi:UNVERIFIED_CONTAM: hypothetical protein NCL1_01220 [Trichonephila clavipes]
MALCLGAALAAGATVPLQQLFDGRWQPALAWWALPALAVARPAGLAGHSLHGPAELAGLLRVRLAAQHPAGTRHHAAGLRTLPVRLGHAAGGVLAGRTLAGRLLPRPARGDRAHAQPRALRPHGHALRPAGQPLAVDDPARPGSGRWLRHGAGADRAALAHPRRGRQPVGHGPGRRLHPGLAGSAAARRAARTFPQLGTDRRPVRRHRAGRHRLRGAGGTRPPRSPGKDTMKQHRYRLTLEHIAAIKAETPLHEPLQFEAVNHDDLFAIIERLREARLFPGDESTAFAVGLKLFTEAMLMHRDHPLHERENPRLLPRLVPLGHDSGRGPRQPVPRCRPQRRRAARGQAGRLRHRGRVLPARHGHSRRTPARGHDALAPAPAGAERHLRGLPRGRRAALFHCRQLAAALPRAGLLLPVRAAVDDLVIGGDDRHGARQCARRHLQRHPVRPDRHPAHAAAGQPDLQHQRRDPVAARVHRRHQPAAAAAVRHRPAAAPAAGRMVLALQADHRPVRQGGHPAAGVRLVLRFGGRRAVARLRRRHPAGHAGADRADGAGHLRPHAPGRAPPRPAGGGRDRRGVLRLEEIHGLRRAHGQGAVRQPPRPRPDRAADHVLPPAAADPGVRARRPLRGAHDRLSRGAGTAGDASARSGSGRAGRHPVAQRAGTRSWMRRHGRSASSS